MKVQEKSPFYIGQTQPDEQQFDAWPDQPLLVSMEMAGIDWPNSCRSGICHTCLSHLESGLVRYAIDTPSLSDEEKSQGQVLPCVAHPCSDVVLRAASW